MSVTTHHAPTCDIRTPVPWAVSIVVTSPEQARTWLEGHNPHNRRIKDSVVTRYARNILNGQWKLTPQAVVFDANGNLADGQHRLAAIVRASVPAPVFLVEGVDPALFDLYDIGSVRTSADVAYIQGTPYSAQIGPSYKLLHQYRMGVNSHNAPRTRLTVPEVTQLAEEEPALQNWLGIAHNRLGKAGINRSVAAVGLHLIASSNPRVDLGEFIDGLATGANLSVNDPRLLLRNRALDDRKNKTPNWHRLAVFIKAWNAWATATPIKVLRFSKSEAMPLPARLQ